ncbi:FecR family protein [Caulobacter radicis]|uniref:FecR family protein n=1 Tax=Caulobacter radicis TaxID=2172650 RepID=UPI001401C7A7|nr:DUF4880 domain-containing protein [Caulobacter radicis]
MTRERLSSRDRGDDYLLQQAAEWLARLDLGTADLDEFARWRDAEPRHALAFLRVTTAADAATKIGHTPPVQVGPRALSRRSAIAAMMLGTLALGGGVMVTERVNARERSRTSVGQTRSVNLAGVGTVLLNTDSVVSWQANKVRVRVWLEQGEIALVLTEGAPEFHLFGGNGEVRLLPGQYNARLKGKALDLMVLRGGVVSTRAAGIAQTAAPRSILYTGGNDQPLTRTASAEAVATALAWRDGEILFIDEPLSTAIEEYNRYLVRKILIVDPQLGGIRVGGRFTTKDPATFLTAIHTTLDIDVVATDANILLTRKTN